MYMNGFCNRKSDFTETIFIYYIKRVLIELYIYFVHIMYQSIYISEWKINAYFLRSKIQFWKLIRKLDFEHLT